MSGLVIEWMAASADPASVAGPVPAEDPASAEPVEPLEECGAAGTENEATPWGRTADDVTGGDRDLCLYRDRTLAILRRYMRMALETGRLPSLLGREFFRTKITSYHTQTFEDSVVFVHDVETCLELLDGLDKSLIALIVLQEHTQEEAARLLGCTERTIIRRYQEALDRVSQIFLERDILSRLPETGPIVEEACQEGETSDSIASDSI